MCEVRVEPQNHEPPMAQATQEKPDPNSTKPRPNRTRVNLLCASVILATFLIVSTIGGISLGLRLRQTKNVNNEPELSQQLIVEDVKAGNDIQTNVEDTRNTGDLKLNGDIIYGNSVTELSVVPEKHIVSRTEWHSAPANKRILELRKPIQYVVVSHTAGRFCETFDSCSNFVRLIQNYHLSQSTVADIQYNFMIGGDGNIYEGRGWDVQNTIMDDSVNVAFIGNYIFDRMSEDMSAAMKSLLATGERAGYLASNYDLVCHNQTANTQSPGPNVYKNIKTFPHFIPDIIR